MITRIREGEVVEPDTFDKEIFIDRKNIIIEAIEHEECNPRDYLKLAIEIAHEVIKNDEKRN